MFLVLNVHSDLQETQNPSNAQTVRVHISFFIYFGSEKFYCAKTIINNPKGQHLDLMKNATIHLYVC